MSFKFFKNSIIVKLFQSLNWKISETRIVYSLIIWSALKRKIGCMWFKKLFLRSKSWLFLIIRWGTGWQSETKHQSKVYWIFGQSRKAEGLFEKEGENSSQTSERIWSSWWKRVCQLHLFQDFTNLFPSVSCEKVLQKYCWVFGKLWKYYTIFVEVILTPINLHIAVFLNIVIVLVSKIFGSKNYVHYGFF